MAGNRQVDEKQYGGQRAFTAWAASIYAFMLMLFGATTLMVTVFGTPTTDLALLAQATGAIALLIPNFMLSVMIWNAVYNGD